MLHWPAKTAALLGLLCSLLGAGALCAAPIAAAKLDTEPTVTRKEAELLATVTAYAATNTLAAIAKLKAADLSEASPALDFALGNLSFQAEQLDAAEQAYRAAIKKLARFRRARANLGRVYLLQDKPKEAVDIYRGMIADALIDADTLILLGHALLMSDRAVSAENAYRQATLYRPDDRDALLGLAKCLLRQERLSEGLSLLQELLALMPIRADLWSLYANARLAQDDPNGALVALASAHRLGIADTGMLATLGDLYLNRNQPAEAAAAYELAFAGDKAPAQRLLRAVEAFILLGDADRADALMKRAQAIREQRDSWLSEKNERKRLKLQAELARLRGDTEAAQDACRQLLREDPLNADAILMLGDLYHADGKLEEAVMAYERAARVSGHEAAALLRHAQVEVERERYTRAVELLEAAQVFDSRPSVTRFLDQVRRLVR